VFRAKSLIPIIQGKEKNPPPKNKKKVKGRSKNFIMAPMFLHKPTFCWYPNAQIIITPNKVPEKHTPNKKREREREP